MYHNRHAREAPHPQLRNEDLPRQIAAFCANLLDLPAFGTADDFFAEGGDSLAAAQLVTLIGKAVPEIKTSRLIAAVFSKRSPAMIAADLESGPRTPVSPEAGNPAPSGGSALVPLSPLQSPIWLSERFYPGTAKWTVATAVRLAGKVDPAQLGAAIQAVAARHEALRTRISRIENTFVQSFDALSEAVVEDVGGAVEQRLQDEANRPFDPHGPLFRARVLCVSELETVLLLTAHHVIMDGWSVSVLLRDIAKAYRGEPDAVSDVPGRYAATLRHWQDAQVTGLRQSVDYWASRFPHGWPACAALYDSDSTVRELAWNPRLAVSLRDRLPAETFRKLASTCAEHGVTPFVAALAAFGRMLARAAGLPEVIIGAAVSRRNTEYSGELVGVFLNFVPAAVPAGKGVSLLDTILATNRLWLESVPFQDAPFPAIQHEIAARRRGRASLHLPFAINFHNYPSADFPIPGAPSRIEHLATGHIQGDLALNVRPARDGSVELELLLCSGRISTERAQGMLRELATTLREFSS